MDNSAKILLLGKTKAGKSSFINYFLGKNVAKAGPGAPVTSEYFVPYEAAGDKYPIYIYDTKGLEALDADKQLGEIIDGIKKQNGSDNIFNWFHTIFYCVSVTERFQDFEADFLCRLQTELSQHIHIILTHCDACSEDTVDHMRQRIKSCLGDNTTMEIFEVVSVEKKKRNGEIVHPHGKEIITERVFDLLLADIADKLSREYASTLNFNLLRIVNHMYNKLSNFADENINFVSFVRMLRQQDDFFNKIDSLLDLELSSLENKFEAVKESTDEKFSEILRPMAELYTSYWDTVTDSNYLENAGLNFYDAIEWVNMDWLDEMDENNLIAKVLPGMAAHMDASGELMDDDNASLSEMLSLIKDGITDIIMLKKHVKEMLRDLKYAILNGIPSEETVRDEARGRIIEYIKPSYDSALFHRDQPEVDLRATHQS